MLMLLSESLSNGAVLNMFQISQETVLKEEPLEKRVQEPCVFDIILCDLLSVCPERRDGNPYHCFPYSHPHFGVPFGSP